MLKAIATALFTLCFCFYAFSNDYDDAWKSILLKDYKTAREHLLKATKSPSTAKDAYLTLLFLDYYQGKDSKIDGLVDVLFSDQNKNAYAYALWFKGALFNGYKKKTDEELKVLNKVIADNSFNGSIQAAAHYVKSINYWLNNDIETARQEHNAMNSIPEWQLAGPFENTSGSGFNNMNGPISHPEGSAEFKGINNINLAWFTPSSLYKEGWVYVGSHISPLTAIVYAQAFVKVDQDIKVLLNAGCNGSLKVWVNDGLIVSEAKERVTELDYYKNYCTLKKGYNRVLVQLGYTNNSIPNFIIRFTDENLNPVKGLGYSNIIQQYPKGEDEKTTHSIKHFAEKYFEDRMAKDPMNLLNYILLSQTYLRDERTTEARQIIEKALEYSPGNPLLKFELMQILSKAGNRTALVQELEWLKENDNTSYYNFQLKLEDLIKEEKYSEAAEELSKMEASFGLDEYILRQKIVIYGKQEKVEEFLKLCQTAYQKYPDNTDFLNIMYNIKSQLEKDRKAAFSVYEKYLQKSFNYNVVTNLLNEYKEQNLSEKYVQLLKQLQAMFPHEGKYINWLTLYYYQKQDNTRALNYAQQALALAPYNGTYWQNIAYVQEALKKKDDAINSLRKGIYYDKTNYDARKKLFELEGKTELSKLLPDQDVYTLIKNAPSDSKYDFNYLLDNKGVIIYDEGASEEYYHYSVKIYNQKGIDAWKETYLNYSDNNQTLLVEKAEVVKKNGSKVPAEREGSQVVFTGLEPGDAIHVKYRLQNYWSGRFGKEFWDKYNFNYFYPSALVNYTIIAPKDFHIKSHIENGGITESVKEVEGFKVYNWTASNIDAIKSEAYMPSLNDVGRVLHVSTLKSWQDVANTYSDIAYQNLSGNYELDLVYNEIFSKQVPQSDLEKARLIYNYILNNIRYSSVSFRQSGLVPQDISEIISTRLGDCKDLSSLFVALASKAGLNAHLVLVDTKNNGLKDMVLPSMDFDHCVVLAQLNGKDYYLELTDGSLPFGSVPANVEGALSLLIPTNGEKSDEQLKPINAVNRKKDEILRKINVKVKGKDEAFSIETVRTGNLVSNWRSDYQTLSEDLQFEEYEKSISNGYKNPVKLESLLFENLDGLSDSLMIKYGYSVKNEVIEAGSMKMIKVPFIDVVATIESFTNEKREFPIEYWNYENTDHYKTEIDLQLDAGQKLIEVPTDQFFKFKNSSYSVKYKREGEKLKIIREAFLDRININTSDYIEFKKFMNDIVEAESKYIVFK